MLWLCHDLTLAYFETILPWLHYALTSSLDLTLAHFETILPWLHYALTSSWLTLTSLCFDFVMCTLSYTDFTMISVHRVLIHYALTFFLLFFHDCIAVMGFLNFLAKLGLLSRGKPATTESRNTTYGACRVFQCFHNPPNRDKECRIFKVRTDVNACDCTQGCKDTVRESAPKVDSSLGFIMCCHVMTSPYFDFDTYSLHGVWLHSLCVAM